MPDVVENYDQNSMPPFKVLYKDFSGGLDAQSQESAFSSNSCWKT